MITTRQASRLRPTNGSSLTSRARTPSRTSSWPSPSRNLSTSRSHSTKACSPRGSPSSTAPSRSLPSPGPATTLPRSLRESTPCTRCTPPRSTTSCSTPSSSSSRPRRFISRQSSSGQKSRASSYSCARSLQSSARRRRRSTKVNLPLRVLHRAQVQASRRRTGLPARTNRHRGDRQRDRGSGKRWRGKSSSLSRFPSRRRRCRNRMSYESWIEGLPSTATRRTSAWTSRTTASPSSPTLP